MKINGWPVVDATHGIKLTISERDVSNGKTKNPGSCAAALACQRLFHTADSRVHIGRVYIKNEKKKCWVRYFTPRSLRTEIIAFDRGGAFEPGEYTLAKSNPADRLGAFRKTGPKTGKAKKRAHYHTTVGIRQHGANR